ncbi:retrotransposon protein, putative, ty1-copia subclass [Tanacetum coccineum]
MTTSVVNNSVFRGFFKKQKLTDPNFIDRYQQLRIVLSVEDKLDYLEQQIPPAPVPTQAGQQVAPEALAAHVAWEEGQSFVQNYNMLGMEKTVNELHAMLKLHEQTLTKKDPSLHAIKAGKIPPPPKRENLAKDSICHQCGDTGHWKMNCPQYLAELLKNKKLSQRTSGSGIFTIELYTFSNKSWVYDTSYGTYICNTTQGPRGSRKLKPGALSLYVGNGQRATVKAIGSYHLFFRNNLVYFSVVPRGGISEIDLSNSNTNDSSMYAVSNKRSKLNLDSTLLWHCRLGHISKKGIKKLQHDELLNSTDIRAFEKCVFCMSGKMLRSVRGGEYMSQEFLDHLKEHGIIAYCTPPYTSQHNGVSERRNRTLIDMVYSMSSQTTLPKSFWDYALETAARILNTVLTKKVEKTPYKVWHGQAPKLSYLRVWGCEALVKQDTLTKPDKLEPRSIKCIFVGYPKETMGYSIYYPPENKVLVARNAKFLENSLITQEASLQRQEMPPNCMCLYINTEEHKLGDLGEPSNYKVALLDPESDKWLNAMNVEIQSMKDNEIWDLVDLPPNDKTVGSNWLFKKKTDIDGAVHTFKAHLVAKGFTQTYGVDYEETFSPVADIRAIRILIAIAAYYDYEIWQMDVKTDFLNRHLSEEVYMEQPKAIGSNVTFQILYVDDILIMGNNIPMLQDVKSYLGRCFAIKDLGEGAYILEIKIYRDRSWRLIGLCQSAYIKKILKRFHMENSKRGSIPMQGKLRLSKSQGASTPTELKRMQNPISTESRVSCYTDAGYLTDADDLKSQTGYVFVLNGGAVDWKSTKQSIFATSSAEAEYIAAYDASKEAVWVRKFISGLGVVPTIEEPINMYCDNTGAITIANESGITKGARHFRAKVHYLREVIEYGDIKLEKVHTDDNLADPFTKALAFPKHSEHTRNIGMLPASSLM